MIKKDIKKLVTYSYKNNKLDKQVAQKIASLLSIQELRIYIKLLKLAEEKRTVRISLAEKDKRTITIRKKQFEKLFIDKNIIFESDQTLLGGIRVVDYDIIYDISIKGVLEDIVEKMEE